MSALAVPVDRQAEEVVIACAVATIDGAALAAVRVLPGEFWWPEHRRLLSAALGLTAVRPEVDRIAGAAAHAELSVTEVGAIVGARPVMFDTAGVYARRVVDAARRRRVMRACEDAYEILGQGGAADEALAVLGAVS